MNYTLGYIETDIGTVIFQMNASNFEIQTPKATFTVYTDDIKEVEGLKVFEIPKGFSGFRDIPYIEIPGYILEGRDEYLKETENSKGNVGSTETNQGKVFFYLTAEGLIKVKLGEIEEYLRIRNPVSSRTAEIDKQRAAAIKANDKLIEKLAC